MKRSLFTVVVSVLLIVTACATNKKPCEDIVLAAEQAKQCQSLQRQIAQAKGHPVIRTELATRYKNDCLDSRFYRDAHKAKRCEKAEKTQD